jgi:hypothetical protein
MTRTPARPLAREPGAPILAYPPARSPARLLGHLQRDGYFADARELLARALGVREANSG